ncbi:PTS sugar transporter subunit IIB [Enterococcus sp. 5H]|uniref:PTS sugar transporter subunit IIB n=1 Tax=Enterococcus sp. 5H TaxID=1229490 RepID=UPI002302B44D|nr:PTS sugar transporter subunit IIB [Enterococcus sp. 5H]MDA9472707.1 PTS system, mannose-specific IIA component [Enterococcus sp. 5H]
MAKIVLTRVDSRLIHGQVVTKWLQQSGADEILVVSDELEKDEFLQSIYVMAAPPGVEVKIYGVESAIAYWKEAAPNSSAKILFLVPDLSTLEAMVNACVVENDIQIGGLGGGAERKNVLKNINLSENDVEILNRFSEKNLNVFFQAIPEDNPMPIAKLVEKYHTL